MNELYVSEDYICIDGELRFSGGDIQPYLTRHTTTGNLYRDCLKEYGKCIGKVWVGEDKPKQVGWVFFQKGIDKNHYDREVWITVFSKLPIKKVSWEVEYPTFKKQRSTSNESAP
jgi:hypothetical protein